MLAEKLLDSARRAFGDLLVLEVNGGDAVGTDHYPAVRDGWRHYVDLLGHADVDTRMAAAYVLSFLLEPAAETQPALDAAVAAACTDIERAAQTIAAARLRATLSHWRDPERMSHDITLLDPAALTAPPIVGAAMAIGQLMGACWYDKHDPGILQALEAANGVTAGPWGGGNLGVLAAALCQRVRFADEPTHAITFCGDPDLEADDASDDEAEMSISDHGDDEVGDPYTQDRPVRAPPRVILPGLHEIDWSQLDHAYCSAEGVPGMIDALTSPDPEDRHWGLGALMACINHQGSVYSASTAAAPFLTKLAGRDDVEDREQILLLLAGLAVHDPKWFLFSNLDECKSEAFDAVAAGAPTYVRLLADPEPAIRSAAAQVLSFITPVPHEAFHAVRTALSSETNRYARSSLLLCLGYLGRRAGQSSDRELLATWLNDDCPLLAGSAAIALAQLDQAASSPTVRAVLEKVTHHGPPVHGFWPWNEGDLAGFAQTVRLAVMDVDELLADMRQAKALGDHEAVHAAAKTIFGLLFNDQQHGINELWLPEEIDPPRREVLEALIDISRRRDQSSLPLEVGTADDVGLPWHVDAIGRLIGHEKGPVDRLLLMEGVQRPAWWIIHAFLMQRVSLPSVQKSLAELSPREQIEWCEDAIDGPYMLHRIRQKSWSDDEAAQAHTSRFILLVADLLGSVGQAGLEWATSTAATQAQLGEDRLAIPSTIASVILTRVAAASVQEPMPEVDQLLRFDQPPASTYRQALREAFRHLPSARCIQLLADTRLYSYQAYRDPRGEVRRWQNGTGWEFLAFAPADHAVAQIATALLEWERHLTAGSDAHATPVGGCVSHPYAHQPPPDEPFPHDLAIQVLVSFGAAALPALDVALRNLGIKDRGVFQEARRQIEI